MRKAPVVCAALFLLGAASFRRQGPVLDDFEDLSGWKAAPSDGVLLSISPAEGHEGGAMRLDFDFRSGAGYAVARKAFTIELPENYEFSFRLRGEAAPNNFEFKLVDPSGENVWWVNRRGVEFPSRWQRVTIKKRHIQFAWGPAGGGEMKRVAAIELAVTAGTGGKGWIAVDELTFRELPPAKTYARTPLVRASSTVPGTSPQRTLDANSATSWQSKEAEGGTQWIAIDFLETREYGGLTIDWDGADFAARYTVETSDDGEKWTTAHAVTGSNGGRDYLFLPETESRHLRLKLEERGGGPGYAIREIAIQPLEFGSSPNAFFEAIARDAPRGAYPRYFSGEQSYWTIVGVDGDTEEGLLNEDGALETGKGEFSVEPFLYLEGNLLRWSDVEKTHTLLEGYLPIPSVTWSHAGISLEITAFAAGREGGSSLYARYRLKNGSAQRKQPRLFLALRPFQVNPPWQFLNTPGGTAQIRELSRFGHVVSVNGGERTVTPIGATSDFGAAAFDQGDITEYLARGALPAFPRVSDPSGFASGAFSFDFDLEPGEEKEVWLLIPFQAAAFRLANPKEAFAAIVQEWKSKLGRVELCLPPAAEPLVKTLRTTLAYILINRDRRALQPGSRSYDRSWIRDGALTSAALLRLGHAEEVRDFIEWYAPYQYTSGKVPCCVDSRGADPVPEHDSHGELIYLIGEHYRFTRDRAFLSKMWPHVEKAVAHLESLRQQRRTPEYRALGKIAFFGLLPESISHEGYSAKPVHSYWDDFWALKGLKDAALLAGVLGKEELARRYAALSDEFGNDLHASLRRTMAERGIAYIPGSAELADFDPSSTSIGVSPGGEMANLPPKELPGTFERYWESFLRRRSGAMEWENYTPYELRNVGTFVRLGWKERAHELLDFFLADRRPAAWNQWAEVVWRDPRAPKFIGDMPHTWVGSDFIRSLLDMFAYVRDEDEALVLAAGVPEDWIRSKGGIAVKGLRTEYGRLDYTLAAEGRIARLRVSGEGLTVPPGGIAIRWSGRETVLRRLPAEAVLP